MDTIKSFLYEEDAIGVVEIILILVILIGLVLIFKENIETMVEDAFKNISDGSDKIIK